MKIRVGVNLILAHASLRHNLSAASGLADQLVHLVTLTADDAFRVGAQNMIKKCRIDRPEVGSSLQVTIIQIGQARLRTEEPAAYASAQQKDRACGAVISSITRIGRDASAEFGVDHGDSLSTALTGPSRREKPVSAASNSANNRC